MGMKLAVTQVDEIEGVLSVVHRQICECKRLEEIALSASQFVFCTGGR
jgi:hypothetical protein